MQYQERFATTIYCSAITNNNRRFFSTFDCRQYNWCFMHSNSFRNVNRIVCIFRLPHISLRLDVFVCVFFSLYLPVFCFEFYIGVYVMGRFLASTLELDETNFSANPKCCTCHPL